MTPKPGQDEDPALAITEPARLGPAGWKTVLLRSLGDVFTMENTLRCAGVAFFGFISLFPAIAIAVFLVGLMAEEAFLAAQLDRVAIFLPPIAMDVLAERLDTLVEQSPSSLGVGLLVSTIAVLWSGSRGLHALIYAATMQHKSVQKRSILAWLALSVVATILGTIFMLLALGLIALLPIIANLAPVPASGEQLALVLRWPLLLLFSMAGISLLYHFTLDRRPARFAWLWPGALIASLLWLIASLIFSLFVENFGGFEASFGSLAAAMVLLLWMYNSALIFVFGATINAQIELSTNVDTTVGPDRPMGQRRAYPADHVLVPKEKSGS